MYYCRLEWLSDGIQTRHSHQSHQPVTEQNDCPVKGDDETTTECWEKNRLAVACVNIPQATEEQESWLDEIVADYDQIAEAELEEIQLKAQTMRIDYICVLCIDNPMQKCLCVS